MVLETKFNENDTVWILNRKTGKAVKRKIAGIRTQSVFGDKRTIYAFLKDICINKDNPEVTDCFWLPENVLFTTREELVKSF